MKFQFALVLGKCDKLAVFRRNRPTGSEDMKADRKEPAPNFEGRYLRVL